MVPPVQEIAEYNGNDFEEYLNTLMLIDIFDDLIKAYRHDKPLLLQITKYIVFVYSLESKHVVIGMEWKDNKDRISEYVFLPNSVYPDVVELKSPVIVATISRWLQHQDNEVYSELMRLKDLRLELQKSYSDITVDINQRVKNVEHSENISERIKKLQSELIQNSIKLKDAAAEVRKAQKKQTFGAEKFASK